MMKIYLTFLALLLILTGCEEYFDKPPQGYPTTENFYGSLNELQLGLNATLDVMADPTWQKSQWLFGDGAGDDCNRVSGISKFSSEGQIMQLNFTPENEWLLYRWKLNYTGIFRANWVIANADNVNLSSNENDIIDLRYIVGQAKTLRAYYYMNLVKTFGAVPIKPESLSIDASGEDNFTQPRNSVDEVYTYIEKDLREGILMLRQDVEKIDYGKITRGFAASLLIKALAYQAKAGVNHPDWNEALKFSEHVVINAPLSYGEILNMNELYPDETIEEISDRLHFEYTLSLDEVVSPSYKYKLSDDYDLLWHRMGEFSEEWIFEVNHVETPDGSANLGSQFSEDLIGWGYSTNIMQPTESLRTMPGSENDPRMKTSIIVQERTIYTGTLNGVIYTQRLGGGHPEPAKTSCHKWATLEFEYPARANDNSKNFRIMRLAEVLLWHAEALNETGDPVAAVDVLNLLRERARKIPVERWSDVDPTVAKDLSYGAYPEVRDMIWNERRVELNCEFDRFWDLVRTGKAKEAFQRFNSKVGLPDFEVTFITGVHELFAIPQSEIDLSNGIISQNPGY
jgi:hypothetical protein